MIEQVEFLVVGCGPAGGTAAREAARAGVETIVLDKDTAPGARRVCAAGLRPRFCQEFDLPRAIVQCDTPRLALFDPAGRQYEIFFGPGHTSTREELDGAIAQLAGKEGASIRTSCLMREFHRERERTIVDYVDLRSGERRRIAARTVFFAQGATAKLEQTPFAYERWNRFLMTTLQYRVYLDVPADPIAYRTLEMHYYAARDGRIAIGWMFPKRDHLAVGIGVMGKVEGTVLREELDAFEARVRARLYAHANVRRKTEGHLLYGGEPRPHVAASDALLGGTAAGLVDATNGEGIFEAAMTGRLAAKAAVEARTRRDAAQRYARTVKMRFDRRLRHRAAVMRYLEQRPARFGVLFEQLAKNKRFADTLQREDRDRSMTDRVFLLQQALIFALRSQRV